MQHVFLERIDDAKEVFYMIYSVAFKHFTFQIVLHSDDKDSHLHGKKSISKHLPVLFYFYGTEI